MRQFLSQKCSQQRWQIARMRAHPLATPALRRPLNRTHEKVETESSSSIAVIVISTYDMFVSVSYGQVREGDPYPCFIRKAPMCVFLRLGLIREFRLSTNHFHCITDCSAKLDYDKCFLISMKSSLDERLASRALGIFGSLIAGLLFGKVTCAGFCRPAFLCPASNFPRP